MKTIALANRKGGVGKSTTAGALMAGLSAKGYKVLGVDLDGQRNLSTSLGIEQEKRKTILGVMTGEVETREAIATTNSGDLLPANKNLAGADTVFTDTGKEYILKEALEEVAEDYDYCIIDCPPALGILTVNALTAADVVIVPAQADIFSLDGISDLQDVIQLVRKYCNPALKIGGILLTRYNGRSVLSRDVADLAGTMADRLKTRLYKTTIREGISIKEAQIQRQNIFDYAKKSKVAQDYEAFIKEFLEEEKRHGKN